MSNWRQLHESAAASREDLGELRRRVDLVSVCLELGVDLEERGDDRWEGRCPFHDDTRPSFAVWWDSEDACQRCGCWSCDFGTGDVYDLVQRAHGVTLGDAVAWVRERADAEPLRPPDRGESPPPEDLGALTLGGMQRAAGGEQDRLQAFLVARGVRAPASWLTERFWVGVDELGRITIPHGTADGQVHALKRRAAPDWTPIAVRGSRLEHLYGAHLLTDDHERVVVVEGESDTWSTAWLLRDDPTTCVLGLPHGAGPGKPPRAEWVAQLVERDVTLLFDADQAGRASLRAWVEALPRVRVAQLAEGHDATSADPAAVRHALEHAIYHGDDWPPALERVPGGLVRVAKDPTPVGNFWLELERVVEVDGEEIVFEVRLPDRRRVLLSTHDLGSETRTRGWANRHGYVWYGTAKDTQELMRVLTMDSVFVPRVPGTRVAGWHDGTFVLPEPVGCVGQAAWAYVPPTADVRLAEKVHLDEGPWDTDVPALLRQLHRPDVVTPIIGWIAAAPLRALCGKFPILAVVGGAGTGKTTLVGTLLRAFGFDVASMLTATTPHAVHSLAASTNAVPVWFDEFRAGARHDARLVLEQVIRDAWDGGASLKGGLRDNRQELVTLRASAPIVVSGEDAFSETSHLERMVLVNMPGEGREPRVLQRLNDHGQVGGLGRAYLGWLVDAHAAGTLPRAPALLDRMEQARAVTTWGWELLRAFTRERCGYDLGEQDLSRVTRAHTEATETPAIVEVVSHFYGINCSRGFPLVWRDDADLCVRVMDVVRAAQRETDLALPGGSRAIKNWLLDRYGGSEERNAWGRFVRLRGAAVDVLD